MSGYYGLTNVTRSTSDAEEDAFSESDTNAFLDKDAEAWNNCLYSDDEKKDNFSDSKVKIKEFKDTLLIPSRVDDEKTLF